MIISAVQVFRWRSILEQLREEIIREDADVHVGDLERALEEMRDTYLHLIEHERR